jgi:hypothetical protein
VLDVAVEHFNMSFRLRYRLPPTTVEAVQRAEGFDRAWADIQFVRSEGVVDASCATIARAVLSIVPRYAIGLITSNGAIDVQAPGGGDPDSYRNSHVLLVNPLGGRDNWRGVAAWVRRYAGDQARRRELAGLASEKRPDETANWALLDRAASEHGRAVVLPPDEGFSAERAAEVRFIFGVSAETLRGWQRQLRAPLRSGKAGAPRKNR